MKCKLRSLGSTSCSLRALPPRSASTMRGRSLGRSWRAVGAPHSQTRSKPNRAQLGPHSRDMASPIVRSSYCSSRIIIFGFLSVQRTSSPSSSPPPSPPTPVVPFRERLGGPVTVRAPRIAPPPARRRPFEAPGRKMHRREKRQPFTKKKRNSSVTLLLEHQKPKPNVTGPKV